MMPVRRPQHWLPSIFNDLLSNEWVERTNVTSPSINVIENDKEFKIEVAAPGMTREDFTVRINEDENLVISLEKKNENKEEKKDGRYLRREFSYSKFQQTLLLPDNVAKEDITAQVEHGVLHISIPKVTEEDTPKAQRVIEVK